LGKLKDLRLNWTQVSINKKGSYDSNDHQNKVIWYESQVFKS